MMNPACQEMKTVFRRNETVCGRVLPLIQLISSKTRFRIICLLLRGEFSVSEIVEVVSEGQLSNVSQQLKALTLAGIVERRRFKRQVLYSLRDERVRRLIGFLQQEFLNEGPGTPGRPLDRPSVHGDGPGRFGAKPAAEAKTMGCHGRK